MSAPAGPARPDRDEVEARVGGYVEGLRDLVTAERASRADFEAKVKASKDREHKFLRAIAALEGGDLRTATTKPKPKPRAQQLIGSKTIDKVLTAVRELTAEPGVTGVTRQEVAERAGVSIEAARRALETLRVDEKVRKAGKRGTGPTAANYWALMPDA